MKACISQCKDTVAKDKADTLKEELTVSLIELQQQHCINDISKIETKTVDESGGFSTSYYHREKHTTDKRPTETEESDVQISTNNHSSVISFIKRYSQD